LEYIKVAVITISGHPHPYLDARPWIQLLMAFIGKMAEHKWETGAITLHKKGCITGRGPILFMVNVS